MITLTTDQAILALRAVSAAQYEEAKYSLAERDSNRRKAGQRNSEELAAVAEAIRAQLDPVQIDEVPRGPRARVVVRHD